MSMNHHGEVFAEKCYTMETLAVVLGYPDVRKVREFRRRGLRGRKEGAVTFITGADFIRWVERGSQECDDDEEDQEDAPSVGGGGKKPPKGPRIAVAAADDESDE